MHVDDSGSDRAFCASSRFFPAFSVNQKSKETILLLLWPPSERKKQRDGECGVVHGVCAITMLITNVEGRSFIQLFVRHLSECLSFVVVGGELGTALPIGLRYCMLCASDSIHSPPYIQG